MKFKVSKHAMAQAELMIAISEKRRLNPRLPPTIMIEAGPMLDVPPSVVAKVLVRLSSVMVMYMTVKAVTVAIDAARRFFVFESGFLFKILSGVLFRLLSTVAIAAVMPIVSPK